METAVINGMARGPVATITVGASPFTWGNPESVPVMVFISAGTVTGIEFSPDNGANLMLTGLLGGAFRLNPWDTLRVTYVLAPTMKYTPN